MNTVELVVVAAVMIAAGLLRAAFTDMFKQEFGTRLAGLPKQLIHIAARRLPAPIREEYLEEWLGELDYVLRETDGLPVARLIRGTRYAAGVLFAVRAIAKAGARDPAPSPARDRAASETTPAGTLRRRFYFSRRAARELEARSRREEVTRNLRWAAELAVSEDAAKARLGLQELAALRDSRLLTLSEEGFIDAALHAVIEIPRQAIARAAGDIEIGVTE
jgi:hypothetical protein